MVRLFTPQVFSSAGRVSNRREPRQPGIPAPGLGAQDSLNESPVVTLVSLANHRLISFHPFGGVHPYPPIYPTTIKSRTVRSNSPAV
jgi:hypothetical protein